MNNVKKSCGVLLLTLVVALSCAGCGSESKLDFSNSTIVGLVTEINGSKLTLQLGELVEQEPPAPPDGGQQGEPGGDKPPAKPEDAPGGDNPPAKPNSQSAEAMLIPQNAPGEANNQPNMLLLGNVVEEQGGQSDNVLLSEQPDDAPEPPAGGKPNELYAFQTNTGDKQNFVTLDLAKAEIRLEQQMQTAAGSLADIAVGDVLELEIGEKNTVLTATVKNLGSGNMGGTVEQGTAANLLAKDCIVHDQTFISTGDDENALRVEGASVSLTDVQVQKTGGQSSNTESGDFYGMNAALLATNGALLTIDKAQVKSSTPNGNGVFSYGEGTVVSISNSQIDTTGDNSGGLQTTGGATMNAVDLTVTTAGNSSAAIRSDRGGGTVNVIGGQYTSRGYNSPAVYSTADITVMNAELNAENSEALVIEGKNSISLLDCTISGNMSDSKGASSDENVHNVMIYQSMSGDAEVGTSTFSAQGGSLTSHNGDMFYVTNTHCLLTLDGVALHNEAAGQLLRVCGNTAKRGWGKAGANGAQVEFLAKHQELAGDITVDSISTLDFQLSEGSVFTGSLNIVPNAEGGEAVADNLTVRIDEGCVWNLTADCTISSLENNGTINYNGYKIITD